MGRGRAKAKQTRVARDLKYRDVGTDLSQLARELQSSKPAANGNTVEKAPDDASDDDEYADYARYADDEDDDYDADDDGGSHRSHHREG